MGIISDWAFNYGQGLSSALLLSDVRDTKNRTSIGCEAHVFAKQPPKLSILDNDILFNRKVFQMIAVLIVPRVFFSKRKAFIDLLFLKGLTDNRKFHFAFQAEVFCQTLQGYKLCKGQFSRADTRFLKISSEATFLIWFGFFIELSRTPCRKLFKDTFWKIRIIKSSSKSNWAFILQELFCRTSLPRASTDWVQLQLLSFLQCPL